MSAFELQLGHGLDSVAALTAEVQLGHVFRTESEPGAVVASVTWSLTASSWDHAAVEELVVFVTDLGSLRFWTWTSVVAEHLW